MSPSNLLYFLSLILSFSLFLYPSLSLLSLSLCFPTSLSPSLSLLPSISPPLFRPPPSLSLYHCFLSTESLVTSSWIVSVKLLMLSNSCIFPFTDGLLPFLKYHVVPPQGRRSKRGGGLIPPSALFSSHPII